MTYEVFRSGSRPCYRRLEFEDASPPGGGASIANLVVAFPMDELPSPNVPATVASYAGTAEHADRTVTLAGRARAAG